MKGRGKLTPTSGAGIKIMQKFGFSKKNNIFKSHKPGGAGGIIFMDFGASYKKSIFIKNVIWV